MATKRMSKFLIFLSVVFLGIVSIAFASWQLGVKNNEASLESLLYSVELYDIDDDGEASNNSFITYENIDIGTGIELPMLEKDGMEFKGYDFYAPGTGDTGSYFIDGVYVSSLVETIDNLPDIDLNNNTIKLYARYGIKSINLSFYVLDEEHPNNTLMNYSLNADYGDDLREILDSTMPNIDIYINERNFGYTENQKMLYKKQWKLNGWYRDVSFQANKNSEEFLLHDDLTLYGKIESQTYNVERHNSSTNNIYNDSTLLKIDHDVPYGKKLNFGATIPTRNPDGRYTYEHNKKRKEFTLNNGVATVDNAHEYSEITVTDNKYAIAQYERSPIIYDITYNLNGGSLESSLSNPLKYTCEDTITLNNPSRIGYTFKGWSGTGLIGDNNLNVTFSDNIGNKNFIANWTPIEYTLRFDYKGGSFNNHSSATYTFTIEDDSFVINSPSKNGYSFEGWTNINENEIVLASSATITPTNFIKNNEVTLFEYDASWKLITYTISLYYTATDDNPFRTLNYDIEHEVTLPLPTDRYGYDFDGYYSERALENKLANGKVLVGNYGDKHYFAKRNPKPLIVYCYVDDVLTYTYSGLHYNDTISLTNHNKVGYNFNGWKDSSSSFYRNGDLWPVFGELKLYADFTPKQTVVTLKGNKGKFTSGQTQVESKTETCTYDQSWNFSQPSRKGYDFTGYTREDNGANFSISGNAWNIENPTLSLLAQRQVRSYKLRFITSTNENERETEIVTYDMPYSISSHNISVPGHEFIGWSTQLTTEEEFDPNSDILADSGVWNYDIFEIVNNEKIINLYPYLTPETYSVDLHYNDGVTETHTIDNIVFNEIPTGIPSSPTRTGYDFDGWYFNTNILQTKIDTTSNWLFYPEMSNPNPYYINDRWQLYAKWNAKTFTVTLDPNGGSVSTSSIICTYDQKMQNLPTPTKTGHSFDGWFFENTLYTTNSVFRETNDIILKAKRTPINYTITWQQDDGSVIDTTSVPYGEIPTHEDPEKLPTAQYTYVFAGWSPTLTSVAGNKTYTATYTSVVNEYDVTFKNYDGTVLQSSKLPYNSMPTYSGTVPIKPSTQQYTYVFSGWSPSISQVTDNQVYVAQFNEILNTYTITWKNYDNSNIEVDENVSYGSTPSYDSLEPIKPDTDSEHFVFDGWSPSISTVVSDQTYIAQFISIPKFEVTFETDGGSQVNSQFVIEGEKVLRPISDPVHPDGYSFAGRYSDLECTTIFNFETEVINSSITIYAKRDYESNNPINNYYLVGTFSSDNKKNWHAPAAIVPKSTPEYGYNAIFENVYLEANQEFKIRNYGAINEYLGYNNVIKYNQNLMNNFLTAADNGEDPNIKVVSTGLYTIKLRTDMGIEIYKRIYFTDAEWRRNNNYNGNTYVYAYGDNGNRKNGNFGTVAMAKVSENDLDGNDIYYYDLCISLYDYVIFSRSNENGSDAQTGSIDIAEFALNNMKIISETAIWYNPNNLEATTNSDRFDDFKINDFYKS